METGTELALNNEILEEEIPDHATVTQIIGDAARDCLALFATLAVNNRWAEDQRRRFMLWTSSIGVFVSGHMSLDYRLRDVPDILELTMQQVAVLRGNLASLIETERDQTLEDIRRDHEIPSSEGRRPDTPDSQESELLSGSDSDEVVQYNPIVVVETTLTKLLKLSAAIRRSGDEYRDSRAENYREKGELLDDGTFDDVTARFEDFVLKMIPYRVPRWIDPDNMTSGPVAAVWLQKRLGKTIARRRNRFCYWRKHQQRLTRSTSVPPISQPEFLLVEAALPHSQSHPVDHKKEEEERSAVPTGDTRPTPINQSILPALLKPKSNRGSGISSVSFTWENQDKIPNPPITDHDATHFICPLCFILCDIKEGGKKHWMKHLIRDLKPYVCIFQDCQTPEKLYGSINEWTSHMTQEEQTFEWYCDSTVHQEVMIFSSQHDFEAHMRNEHESPMSNLELSRFSDRHRRPGVKLFLECPLCYFAPPEGNDYQTQDILRRHVASHLQSLSLFSLPNLPDDGFSYDQSEEPSERANGQDDNADGGSLQAPLSSFHTPPTESTVDDLIVGGDTSHAEEFELDPYYRVHHSYEFNLGKVFKVLWGEPANAGGPGDQVYQNVRRFVVMQPLSNHCICLPINKYVRGGTLRKGINPRTHTIVYSRGEPVYVEGEKSNGLTREPVKVVAKNPRHHLAEMSRLDYSKQYTVEYNVKVRFIGQVDEASMSQLFKDFNSFWGSSSIDPHAIDVQNQEISSAAEEGGEEEEADLDNEDKHATTSGSQAQVAPLYIQQDSENGPAESSYEPEEATHDYPAEASASPPMHLPRRVTSANIRNIPGWKQDPQSPFHQSGLDEEDEVVEDVEPKDLPSSKNLPVDANKAKQEEYLNVIDLRYSYEVNQRDLEAYLIERYGGGKDFKIYFENDRWCFTTPKELTRKELKDLVREVAARGEHHENSSQEGSANRAQSTSAYTQPITRYPIPPDAINLETTEAHETPAAPPAWTDLVTPMEAWPRMRYTGDESEEGEVEEEEEESTKVNSLPTSPLPELFSNIEKGEEKEGSSKGEEGEEEQSPTQDPLPTSLLPALFAASEIRDGRIGIDDKTPPYYTP